MRAKVGRKAKANRNNDSKKRRIKQKGLKIMLRSFSKTARLGVDHVLRVKIY